MGAGRPHCATGYDTDVLLTVMPCKGQNFCLFSLLVVFWLWFNWHTPCGEVRTTQTIHVCSWLRWWKTRYKNSPRCVSPNVVPSVVGWISRSNRLTDSTADKIKRWDASLWYQKEKGWVSKMTKDLMFCLFIFEMVCEPVTLDTCDLWRFGPSNL